VHVRSVLLGTGARLFDGIGSDRIRLESARVSGSPGVTHLRYTVLRGSGHDEGATA
jgi:hypothetical protein